MPCGGFAQEFGGGGITHQLGDFETELGLAAMIASVVHAVGFRSILFCSIRTSKRLLYCPPCRLQWHRGAVLITSCLTQTFAMKIGKHVSGSVNKKDYFAARPPAASTVARPA